ncbi:MAG: patatin-like phospholipase family protein [Kiritimatiellae bacterium]|nr:patatin-like phospholipase family protein [Kiritimatiellia bacterium]
MKIGLALGGGGVRGLAHIPVLEAFDEAGVIPAAVAGTSMGAILGALYAAGRSGRAIRRRVLSRAPASRDAWRRFLRNRAALARWLRAIRPDFRQGGLLRTDRVIGLLADDLPCETFEELRIPLRVVAADFWTGEALVLDRGPLLSAIQASMAVPGVFAPVERDGHLLVDGGLVNLVPWDLLRDRCDRVIAVHVAAAAPPRQRHRVPTVAEAVLGAFDIGHAALLAERLRVSPPDLWVPVPLRDIGIFEFTRAQEALRRGEAAAATVRQALAEWTGGTAPA